MEDGRWLRADGRMPNVQSSMFNVQLNEGRMNVKKAKRKELKSDIYTEFCKFVAMPSTRAETRK
jgi:hypothetical protein